ncbi:MAG: hypothetical protein DHS20C15_31670 [Planctomycetota bacterium]|nr:MAG: hypothetical protein DHS20C15_31670 [Planctomycetota bacterium]
MNVPPSPRALELHALACERGDDGYVDPEHGFFVFSSAALRRAGACCGRTCRHCPWDAGEQARAGREAGAPAWVAPSKRAT